MNDVSHTDVHGHSPLCTYYNIILYRSIGKSWHSDYVGRL